jgi:hypothetical protein
MSAANSTDHQSSPTPHHVHHQSWSSLQNNSNNNNNYASLRHNPNTSSANVNSFNSSMYGSNVNRLRSVFFPNGTSGESTSGSVSLPPHYQHQTMSPTSTTQNNLFGMCFQVFFLKIFFSVLYASNLVE